MKRRYVDGFGAKVKAARIERGWSLKQLADEARVGWPAVRRLEEYDWITATAPSAIAVAAVLGLSDLLAVPVQSPPPTTPLANVGPTVSDIVGRARSRVRIGQRAITEGDVSYAAEIIGRALVDLDEAIALFGGPA